jgi:hypothetical protein
MLILFLTYSVLSPRKFMHNSFKNVKNFNLKLNYNEKQKKVIVFWKIKIALQKKFVKHIHL